MRKKAARLSSIKRALLCDFIQFLSCSYFKAGLKPMFSVGSCISITLARSSFLTWFDLLVYRKTISLLFSVCVSCWSLQESGSKATPREIRPRHKDGQESACDDLGVGMGWEITS